MLSATKDLITSAPLGYLVMLKHAAVLRSFAALKMTYVLINIRL